MVKSDKNMLFLVIVAVLAIMTLGGLGNAAYSVKTFYWVPFILDIPFFGYVCYKLFKTEKIVSGTGSGAALPTQGENEKVDNITDKPRDRKTGRYIKSDGGKAK